MFVAKTNRSYCSAQMTDAAVSMMPSPYSSNGNRSFGVVVRFRASSIKMNTNSRTDQPAANPARESNAKMVLLVDYINNLERGNVAE
jgi:hypothetical protein